MDGSRGDEGRRDDRAGDWFTPHGRAESGGNPVQGDDRTYDWFRRPGPVQGGRAGQADQGGSAGASGTGEDPVPTGQYGDAGRHGDSERRSGPYQRDDPGPAPGDSGGYGPSGGGGWDGGARRRRGKPAMFGPLAGAVALALLAGVAIYKLAGSAGDCGGSGAVSLNVVVAPEIAPAVNATAKDFNAQKQSVGGKCVKAVVSGADPAAVTTLLAGQGVTQGQGQKPDVWIPDTSLWADLVLTSDKGRNAVRTTTTSVAQSPIVVAMPKALAARLAASGITSQPSWDNLLGVAGGFAGGAVTKNETIPPGLVKLVVPDPTRTAAGLATLTLVSTLLASDPNRNTIFTGMVRTVQHSTAPTVDAAFRDFTANAKGEFPVVLAPEQAVWKHDQGRPADPAVAVYPIEGTVTLDYPYTVTTSDSLKAQAAALLEKAMSSAGTQNRVRELGFRSSGGLAPTSYGNAAGVSPRLPRKLPTPAAQDVAAVMQAWSKLSLSIRMLSIFDISGSMAEKIPGTNLTRIQGTAQAAQAGLGLLSDDTELGQWVFSTDLVGSQPWKQVVSIGPLSDRAGSVTRRELIQNALAKAQVKSDGDTALYRTLLAAYRYLKSTYQPDKINSILLLTDGKNDDPGPGGLDDITKAVSLLKAEYDPKRPVKVFMLGFGKGADSNELLQLADATQGSAKVVYTLPGVQKFLLEAIAKRLTAR